jgi:MFS family permease
VVVLAAILGLLSVVSGPTRQSFISELVNPELVGNAIALNSVVMSTARIAGPAGAGLVIAAVGTAPCFWFNSASFLAVIAALRRMRVERMRRPAVLPPRRGQIRAGLKHVWSLRNLLVPMVLVTVTGTLAWEYPVTLPLLATETFAGTASTYGAMTSCLAIGAVLGGLAAARRQQIGLPSLSRACLLWGVVMILAAAAPTTVAAFVLLVGVGLLATTFNAQAKTLLQLSASPQFRGRVMAVWVIAWQGSTLVGGPVVGAIAEFWSARWALAVGGLSACLVAACALLPVSSREVAEREAP